MTSYYQSSQKNYIPNSDGPHFSKFKQFAG
jgi:hypothetical protein